MTKNHYHTTYLLEYLFFFFSNAQTETEQFSITKKKNNKK